MIKCSGYYTSHFSGCGGSTLGAIAAGLKPISAIEFDPKIAELYQVNCGSVAVEDITQVNFKKLDIPTRKERNGHILIHQTSPPCQDFSRANTSANKSSDRANVLAATYEFYGLYEPEFVVLENVPDYAKAKVYQEFELFLINKGYRILKGKFNAADYGVPQTRERFLSIAITKGFDIPQIISTHGKQEGIQINLFTKPWIGWYEAIADLIPTLPDSHLTPKQKEAANGQSNLLIERIGYRDNPSVRRLSEPCWTIRATLGDDKKGGNRNKVIDAILDNATVKSVTTPALARLQSFPDSYKWSGKAAVDTKGIGNSVAPLLMQRICEAIKLTLR